jgi:arginyl-tRNA synthetase
MPTVASRLDSAFRAAIRSAFGVEADPQVGPSQNDKFGDYQANAAMGLAKVLSEKTGQKTNPRAVAEQIKAKLELGEMASEVSIAGPGFINVRLSPTWLSAHLREIGTDPRLGVSTKSNPQTVIVDYSGPNIAKEMHVGHLRSTIIGDALSRTLEFVGDRVIRQNHIGDWGTQFGRVVLAMWYEAAFGATGNQDILRSMIERQQSAARAYAQDQNKAALELAIAAIVREIGPWHQRFISEDPDGERYFQPYLDKGRLELDELERAYVFVSTITDHRGAAEIVIKHPKHGARTLA